ncbi:sensor histidine kinase [Amycolatopsis sp. CA-126428]|uniref:sensor histidine kinase n=1 Tax=Amycolatopsis sp. CA-126428 TaxID=2073158 RepID=UPI001304DA67|nr:HAMP domain-containing sensor histidine kinase [Amycolatopsis sp. CA-126428]
MWAFPGAETIPFHFVWISIAIVFGVNYWPLSGMLTVLGFVTASTGAILWHHAMAGDIGLEETSEIPLMAAVFLVMVWHVRGRQAALAKAEQAAATEHRRAETQDLFVRLGSHEMKTSLTIARGYVELIRAAHENHQTEQDAGIVLDELTKLEKMTAGLTTLMQLNSPADRSPVDLDAFAARTVRRWEAVAERDWRVDCAVGVVLTNEERLQAALDSLIENAVAFTRDGELIAVTTRVESGRVFLEVTDSGRGICPEDQQHIFTPRWSHRDGDRSSGLGLTIVRTAVENLGGTISVASEPGVGTTFRMRLPSRPQSRSILLPAPQRPRTQLQDDPPAGQPRSDRRARRGSSSRLRRGDRATQQS